jgi:chloramphenicol-sensitive protein RarD
VGERVRERTAAGLLYGLAAYGLWGIMPLYFGAVTPPVGPAELLAQRIVWCFVLLVVVLTLLRRWPDFGRCLRCRRNAGLLVISSGLVAVNWLVYLHGVSTGRIVQTSLGYFINPLFSMLLGVVFFRERLRPWQAVAVLLATVGVVYHVRALAEWPWIALVLAGSFGLYGLVRKVVPVDALVGLTVETLVLLPAAVGFLVWQAAVGSNVFGRQGLRIDLLVLASGVVTAVPLACFGAAARRLPLSTLGFIQYLAPSMQLGLAVARFGEPFTPEHAISFGFIWAGLALFTVESLLARRQPEIPPEMVAVGGAEPAGLDQASGR